MKETRDLSNALAPEALSFLKGTDKKPAPPAEATEKPKPKVTDSNPTAEEMPETQERNSQPARDVRVSFNIRIPEDVSKALMKTSFDRRLARETPATLQDIGTEALREWLERRKLL